ncbi:MAG: ThuA domain-containing protein [Defluviitaleaceae bacterium]|nr:ThuA domain-containing protein [Defluviitaleaceae bacterium]
MRKDVYNILLITGVVTSDHEPRINTMLRAMLESTGRFRVKITEEFRGATAETLEGYDAVLINYDGKDDQTAPYVGWGENAEGTLYDYAAAGGGVIVFHSSVIKGEPALPDEFVKLVGLEFDFFNGMRKSPKLEFAVNMVGGHEIVQGLQPVWLVQQDDLFVNPKRVDGANVTVLATVRDDIADYEPAKIQKHRVAEFENVDLAALPGIGADVPVAWTNMYGKGRVFAISIAHGPDTLRRPVCVAMLCRAAEWVCSGEVTIQPPDLSGENRLRAWPYYLDITWREHAAMTQYL